MKGDPNDKVMTVRVIAGNFPDMIMARRGWGPDLFESQRHRVKLYSQFDKSLPKFQAGKTKANRDQRLLLVAAPVHRLAFRRHCCI